MFDTESKKKRWWHISLVALALLVIIIIFYDKFSSFFGLVGDIISVVNSIFVGAAIAYILNPLERFFSRKVLKKMKSGKWHKILSILFTYLLIIGILISFFLIIIPQLAKSVSELPPKLKEFIDILTVTLNDWMASFERSSFYKSLVDAFGAENVNLNNIVKGFLDTFVNIEHIISDIANSSVSIIGRIYSFAADALIGFVLSIYLLSAKSRLAAQGKMITTAVLGESKSKKFIGFLKFSDRTFGGFIQGKLINSFITGVISGIFFSIFGLPYPILLGVIVGVTDIIPVFGPFIGGIPCAFLVLIAAPHKILLFIIIIVLIQQFDGNYIAPKILGESTGLSSLGVFIAIIVMGGYFGLPGMIIGVPLFAVIFMLIKNSVESKLAKRGLSSDIFDYYSKYSDDLMNEEHKSYFKKVVDLVIEFTKKLAAGCAKLVSKLPKIVKKEKNSDSHKNNTSDSELSAEDNMTEVPDADGSTQDKEQKQ